MNILYQSTRGGEKDITASKAILKGLANDGGLFVPQSFPVLDKSLEELSKMDYREVAYNVMKLFFTDFTEEELRGCINGAYDSKFDDETIAPMVYAEGAYYLELFHGKTIAFKDMALSILPYLMTVSAKKNEIKEEIVILTATSGDTGKAALAGFADVPGTRIVVFYPKGGVSKIQELQMVTQKGANTKVVGIKGNFDDAQTGVKNIFADKEFEKELKEKGFILSSANSINIGRLIPQVCYYVFAYTRLVAEGKIKSGDPINVCVPTGNFGNILAASYAKKIGVPVNKLICASNENKVLFDFFETGKYDANREFILTSSPSMDILISSNLERLIFEICAFDSNTNSQLMTSLKSNGVYNVSKEMAEKLNDFVGLYASEEETAEKIKSLYESCGYVIDTHTAVAAKCYDKFVNTNGADIPVVIASTASPFKFARSVMTAIDKKYEEVEDFELIDILSKIGNVKIPGAIEEIRNADILHNTVCEKNELKLEVEKFLV